MTSNEKMHSNVSHFWAGAAKTVVHFVALSLAVVLVTLGGQAIADGVLSTDNVPVEVPYGGHLSRDGVAYTGSVTMTFSLFDGTAVTPSYIETQTVHVMSGQFGVMLGTGTVDGASTSTLAQMMNGADLLHLSISMDTPNGAVVFTERERFMPVMASIWARTASRLDVGNAVTVDSDIGNSASGSGPLVITDSDNITMTIDGNEIDSTSDLYLNRLSGNSGQLGNFTVLGGGANVTNTVSFTGDNGNGGVAFEHGSSDQLIVNPDDAFGDRVYFDGAVTITGDVLGLVGTVDTQHEQTYTGTNQSCPDGQYVRVIIGQSLSSLGLNGEQSPNGVRCASLDATVQ